MTQIFDTHIQEHTAHLIWDDGQIGHPMGPEFWKTLPQLIRDLDQNPKVRAIVISAQGPHFTFGLDLKSIFREQAHLLMGGPKWAKQRMELLQLIHQMQDAFNALEACRKPIIAAVQGWCIGGGLEMISACDIRLCTQDAQFSLKETQLAIVSDLGGLQRLPHIIGQGHLRELAFTGEPISAQRAKEIHLVNHLYPDHRSCVQKALELAQKIAQNPPLAVQGVKTILNQSRALSVQQGLNQVAIWNAAFLQSLDLIEAISAFYEKRKPVFKGE